MFDRQAKAAFIVLCISLLVCGLGFRAAINYLNITLQKKPVHLREHFATIPRTLGDWKALGEDTVLPAETIESLGTNVYLDRFYSRNVGEARPQIISFHLAYFTGMIDAMPHVPDRCMQVHGLEQRASEPTNIAMEIDKSLWPGDPTLMHKVLNVPYPTAMFAHHVTGRPVRVHLPIGEYILRAIEFSDPQQPGLRIWAGYFFIANGRVTPVPWGVKKLAFEPREKYAYYCKVQFTMTGDENLPVDAFVDAVSDLTEQMLPRLMQCLPDWAEVERRLEESPDVASSQTNAPGAGGKGDDI